MSGTAKKTDPKLWDKVKHEVTSSDKGGKAGQWSARKAQMAVSEYKKAGGGYEGKRSGDNHLREWTKEDWGTKSGGKSEETGERYLPRQARETLSDKDYQRSTSKKRRDTECGRQFSDQPKDVARKTRPYRESGNSGSKTRPTKSELYARAQRRDVAGRSRMSRDELEKALA